MKKDYSTDLTIPEFGPMTLVVEGNDFDEVNGILEFNYVWFTPTKPGDGTFFLTFDPGQDIHKVKYLLGELVED